MMNIQCPKCQSTKVKKNGRTHYGKQNHKCNSCSRQFVLNNTHTVSEEKKDFVGRALKERISLRGLGRIFEVSKNWVVKHARGLWSKCPDSLGLGKQLIKDIGRLQVFGLQADEMWSYVQNRANKKWIWVVFDPVHRVVVAYHIGGRGKKDAKKLWRKIPKLLRKCTFETDDWDAYKSIIKPKKHRIGKDLTYFIEGFNATIRARISRLVRRTLSFSKKEEYHNLAIGWFFWQYNLEQQPYI